MINKPSEELRKYLASLGREGGKVRASKLTKKRRQEIAREGGKARQAKARKAAGSGS